MRWLGSIINLVPMNLSKLEEIVKDRVAGFFLGCGASLGEVVDCDWS